jgi:hypothetical protein
MVPSVSHEKFLRAVTQQENVFTVTSNIINRMINDVFSGEDDENVFKGVLTKRKDFIDKDEEGLFSIALHFSRSWLTYHLQSD